MTTFRPHDLVAVRLGAEYRPDGGPRVFRLLRAYDVLVPEIAFEPLPRLTVEERARIDAELAFLHARTGQTTMMAGAVRKLLAFYDAVHGSEGGEG